MSTLHAARQHSSHAQGAWRVLVMSLLWILMFGAYAAAAAASSEQKELVASQRIQTGIASVYAKKLDGKETASGEAHDSDDLTAAHRTLPLGTEVRVTNLANRRSVVVRINDRGPAVKSRIIDLSPRAAAQIGLRAEGKGITRVRVEVVRWAPAAEKDAKAANQESGATERSARPPEGALAPSRRDGAQRQGSTSSDPVAQKSKPKE